VSRVLVICARRYNGHELWTALGVMQKQGHTFEVVSTSTTIMDELTLRPNTIERTINQVQAIDMFDFDALMIVSGNMDDTEAYWTNDHVQSIVKHFGASDKPVAAICCSAPTVAPIAKGKRVSFYPLVRSRQRLKQAGALLQTVAISVDGKLVTAEHQMATEMWAEEFCNVLAGKPPIYVFEDSGFVPRGRPRRMAPEISRMINAAKDAKKTQF